VLSSVTISETVVRQPGMRSASPVPDGGCDHVGLHSPLHERDIGGRLCTCDVMGRRGMDDNSLPVRELIEDWERRCRVNIDTHAWAERAADRLNGVCAVLSVGSLVGLGVVASSFDLTKGTARYLVLALSIVAALVTVVATVRNYGVQAVLHRNAARQYAALRREIERLAIDGVGDTSYISERLKEIQQRWDWAADVAPNAPQRIRRRAREKPRKKFAISSTQPTNEAAR
jgi:hypothetical protein